MDRQDDQLRQRAEDQPEFARHLGARVIHASADRVEMEMPVTPPLANRNGVLHGGAIMGLADNAGGTATFMNLPAGVTTTTLESKTNFLRPIRLGDTARAVATPLHRGRDPCLANDDHARRRKDRRHRHPDATDPGMEGLTPCTA